MVRWEPQQTTSNVLPLKGNNPTHQHILGAKWLKAALHGSWTQAHAAALPEQGAGPDNLEIPSNLNHSAILGSSTERIEKKKKKIVDLGKDPLEKPT